MNTLIVAYNDCGDLVAEAYSYNDLIWRVERAGYDIEDVLVARITP